MISSIDIGDATDEIAGEIADEAHRDRDVFEFFAIYALWH
jgi:hypothetical protein